MFNFTDIVSNILLEQTNPQLPIWFNRILEKYDKLNFTDTKVTNNDTVLSDIYTKVAGKPNVAQQDIRDNIQFVGIYDLLRRLYTETSDKSKAKTWSDFKTQLVSGLNVSRYEQICNNDWRLIQNLTEENKNDWPIQNVQVKNAYDAAIKEIASLGEKALQADPELSNSSVVDAVQKIVNRRIGTFARIAKLKNPKTPFKNLINDIFRTPELYLSGSKKYSSDFAAIDQLYIQDLIKVAIAAKEFYAAEVTRLKTQTSKQTNLENINLHGFAKLVNKMLVEDQPRSSWLPSTQRQQQTQQPPQNSTQQNQTQQNQQTGSISPSIIKQLKDKALQDVRNRMNFLTGIPVQYTIVDQNGKDTDRTGVMDSSKNYNVGGILKIQTPEAQNLIQTLGAIAQYTKKKPGAGERMLQRGKALQGAAQAAWGMSGQSLYGGPR